VLTVLQWVTCGCARYQWGNAAHTFITDVYGRPLLYLVSNQGSAAPSLKSSSVPSPKSSAAPSTAPSATSPAPSAKPSVQPTALTSTLSSAPTLAPSAIPIAIPIAVTGWYQYDASIGLRSASLLPLGLNTLDGVYTILQWTTCGCARYSWGNAAHTLVNDVYGHPIIYLQATVPSGRPTIAPSAPTAIPTIQPSSAPQVPFYAPTAAPVTSKAPTNVVLSYNMVSHGGQIIQLPVVKLIFWGSSWASAPGDKIYGMDLFYKGWSGSGYANIVTEYSGKNGQQASSSINYQGYVVDSSTPKTIDAGSILNEVCAQISDPDPSGNGYYVVYTEMKRGSAGYCGWHSHGSCKGIPVQFGFIFNLDGDNACSAGPPPANPGWQMSQGVHALADVSAHELAETITNPDLSSGWYDSSGGEIGDKCSWTYPAANEVFSNGITWRVQGEWSNSAAIAGTGYPTTVNGATVYGCLFSG